MGRREQARPLVSFKMQGCRSALCVFFVALVTAIVVCASAEDTLASACDQGWPYFDGHCYLFSTDIATFIKARTTCKEKGGDLVSIHSSQEQLFLYNNRRVGDRYWLGYNDFDTEGDYIWTDGTKSGYTNWGPGLPDNYGYEDCAYMDPGFYGAGGNWNDVWCFQYYNYICKKRITPSSCDDKPCQNGGVCETDGTGGYQCKCKAGYTGKNCQEDNYCQSGWNHYEDFCYRFSDEYLHFDDRHTWQGALARCQSDGANLVSIHSKDESNFIFDHMGYSRGRFWIGLTDQEREGFFKWSDGTKLDFINWSPRIPDNAGNEDCAHIDSVYFGSQWSDVWCGQIYGYVCKKAAEDFDQCASQPCQNGAACNNLKNDYSCQCLDGFEGNDCGININDCAVQPCQNGGVCSDMVNDYHCKCGAGYEGKNCTVNIDECDSQPCQNDGTCEDLINDYRCDCVAGYDGKDCGINIDECELFSQPCQNDGTCVDLINDYRCDCVNGYEGKDCEINIDECKSQPCQNDGTCVDLINDYRCDCVAGYDGNDCENNIDECELFSQPCQNDGTCVDLINDYRCDCVAGYEGKDCEINIDECKSQPCQNDGTCVDLINDYRCDCVAGYDGKDCENNIDECALTTCLPGFVCVDGINSCCCMAIKSMTV